jgi:hypothetical protein
MMIEDVDDRQLEVDFIKREKSSYMEVHKEGTEVQRDTVKSESPEVGKTES